MGGNAIGGFKTKDRDKYYSKKKFKSHAECQKWVTGAITTLGLKNSDIKEVIWPWEESGGTEVA